MPRTVDQETGWNTDPAVKHEQRIDVDLQVLHERLVGLGEQDSAVHVLDHLGSFGKVRLVVSEPVDAQRGNLETGLVPGAFRTATDSDNQRLVALNRPDAEDFPETLNEGAIESLLEGVEFRLIKDEVGSGSSLAAEIWRAFLVAMALALLAEAILSLPPRPEPETKAKPI